MFIEEESKQYSVSSKQSAVYDAELQSSEMFIEKEPYTNPVATTNENQSESFPCDSKTENEHITSTELASSTKLNIKHQTSTELASSTKLNFFNAQWAGANNPLWIIRSSKNLTGFQNLLGLEEVKPDKMPIAIYDRMVSFTNHEIQLQKGDTIYLMSDGFQDQFGGPNGKKYKSYQLKKLLIDNSEKSLSEQKAVLETTLINWIGDGEQIDDITILGIKV